MSEQYKMIILILLSVPFFTTNLNSQEINLSAAVDRNVISLDEPITFTVTVSGNIARVPKPKLPPIDDFDIFSQGTSRNITFINGKISSSINYTYSLIPKKTGKFTIGSCELTVKGNTFKTEPIDIEVTKETKKVQKGREQKSIFPFEEKKGIKRGVNIFIKTSVNKKTVYIGEELILTFKLFNTANLVAQPQYIPAETKGFWKEDMGKEKRSTEIIDGRVYEVVELNYALFPLTSGKLKIGEAQLNCVIDDFTGDPFSFGFRSGTKKKLVSDPITINVLPLPPEPADFSGAVGAFEIYATLDKDTTEQNEPITLITTITGCGNLRDIESPEIKIPGFRIYDSGSEVKTYESRGELTEKRIFKTILVPNRSGDFEIQGFSFTFFNPKKAQYITTNTKRLVFKVLPGEGGSEHDRFFGKGDVKVVGKDINFIKTESRLKNEALLGSTKYFLMVNILLLGAFLWIFISQGVKERMKSKEDILRKRGALSSALKVMEKAKREARRGDVKEAYELLHRAILQFFADKCNLSVWGTTEDEIKYHLREKRISNGIEKEISLLLEECNKARYSKERPDRVQFTKDVECTIKLLKSLKL